MESKQRLFACGSNPTGSIGLPSQDKISMFNEVLLDFDKVQHVSVVWSTLTRTIGKLWSIPICLGFVDAAESFMINE